ncbi:hypothetical protein BJY00DRAFT_320451 [Aspergillus carlsbadensis]|nr:hypothetical protein BJY00DRAFT_320451 [Aspergillus carlsbadensis]
MPSTYHDDVVLPATPELPTDGPSARTIAKYNATDLSDLLHDDSWWRDMLAFDWDFHTLRGRNQITGFVTKHQPRAQMNSIRLVTGLGQGPVVETPQMGTTWVRAMFEFETYCGRGIGVVYVTHGDTWKAFAVYTALQDISKFVERVSRKRLEGTVESLPGGLGQRTWSDRRQMQVKFKDEEPTVLVLGAGQSGLNIGARLRSMGVSCVVIEQNDRYSPKDKLADWFEGYAMAMDLNIWLQSTVTSAVYDDDQRRWSVTVQDSDGERVFEPHHIVWCGGQFGVEKIRHFPTQPLFQGTIYHSKAHRDAALMSPGGKKVVVVGSGNSEHDIAQDFYENGAQVTMIQRGTTYVLGQAGLPLLPENAFVDDDSMPLEVVDILSESLPWPVALALLRHNTNEITTADKELLDGLQQSGFGLNRGPNGQGIIGLYVHRGGGYYIDFGCSQLIIDGKIQVKQCAEGVAGFDERHVLLGDGTRLEADIVVLATGYHGALESVRRVLGSDVADRCNKEVWGLDEAGEIRTVWRPSGHPGFWLMGGNLAQSRVYSKFLALQIAATEAGLVPA